MNTDFATFSINEIELSSEVELTEDLIQQIRTASPADKDNDSTFYDVYKVEKNGYYGWMAISIAEDSKTCNLSLHYESGRARKLTKQVPSVNQALGILSKISEPIELSCSLTFEFAKRDRVKTVLNLPLVLTESPKLPFNEIRGLHLSKSEGRISKCDVILDRRQDGSLTEILIFRHTGNINASLLDDIVSRAREISGSFVFKEK